MLYSLDATSHQFDWAPDPFLTAGVSPLKAIYSSSQREHLVSENQTWFSHDLFAQPYAYVRREISTN